MWRGHCLAMSLIGCFHHCATTTPHGREAGPSRWRPQILSPYATCITSWTLPGTSPLLRLDATLCTSCTQSGVDPICSLCPVLILR
ncbi:hypothetical protein B0H11DRAFT_762999 [Mycena galericulata]|nr:hypothetical protein B0H11DRAFT_762999 [Mycena galericulata]